MRVRAVDADWWLPFLAGWAVGIGTVIIIASFGVVFSPFSAAPYSSMSERAINECLDRNGTAILNSFGSYDGCHLRRAP